MAKQQFDPSQFKPITTNGFNPAEFKPISEPIYKDTFTQIQEAQQKQADMSSIVDNIPDMDDHKKETLKDLVNKGVKGEELSNSILTLQGKHPKQEGGVKFYMNNKGVPVPLANSERPPVGYEVSSIWGSQKEANDDDKITTLAKNLYNILPGLAENAVDLIHLPYGLVEGKEADWYKTLKNSANFLKMQTSDVSKAPILNTQGIDELSDIFDSKRWNFTPDNVVGTVGSLAKSVGEFFLGGTAIKGITGASKLGKATNAFTASYMTQLGEVIDSAKEAGLSTEDAYKFGAVVTAPLAIVDMGLGVDGRIFKDQLAQSQNKQLIKNLAKGFVKDNEGKITKEALDDAFKATMLSKTALAKTWGKETLVDAVGEAGQESIQQFIQNAGEQLYDKMSGEKKFGTDAFSPKSFADYLQNGIAGLLGGAPTALAYNNIKNVARENEQSKSAFGVVTQGEDAIKAFKQNAKNEFDAGKLNKEEFDNVNYKIDSYKNYHDQTQDLTLPDEKKRELFDKTFQKTLLENQLNGADESTMNAIERAKHEGLKTQAKHIQEDINKIVLEAQIKEEPTLGDKTIEDQIKREQKPEKKEGEVVNPLAKALRDRYKKDVTPKKEETRTYKEIPKEEFNQREYNARFKHEALANELEATPDKKMQGVLVENPFEYDAKQNSTFSVELPDGKKIGLASSMVRNEGFRGHMRTEHLVGEKDLAGFPVGVKLEYLPDGKKVIKIYNGKTGKFISWAKETNSGKKKEVSEKQIDQLEHLATQVEPPLLPPTINEPINPVKSIPTENNVDVVIGGKPVEFGDDFKTWDLGNREGKPEKEHQDLITKDILENPNKPIGETGESFNAFRDRVIGRFEKILADSPDNTVIITHSSVLKMFHIWNNMGRPDIHNMNAAQLKKFAKDYTNIETETGDVEKFDSDHGVVWVVRHGETEDNLKGNLRSPETQLTEKGIKEAVEAKKELKDVDIPMIISSILPRAQHTAHILLDAPFDYAKPITPTKDTFIEDINKPIEPKEGEQLQKQKQEKPSLESSVHEAVNLVTKHIQSVLPKVKVVYNKKLAAAGKLTGNTIEINPYYAGIDTPIHEAGHVLIDTIGYNNKVIQAAINQLKNTDLWKETKERYPELSDEMLGKEVLAEAIGREGANIFDKEVEKNKFKQYLDYIFNWLKTKLGINKNIAKSLSKQIIAGIGTKEITGKEGEEQEQKESGLNKTINADFQNYREKSLKRNVKQEQEDLEEIEKALDSDISADEKDELESIKEDILNAIEQDRTKYKLFSSEMNKLNDIVSAVDLKEFSLDELIGAYNNAKDDEGYIDNTIREKAKQRIGFYLNEQGKERLSKHSKFIAEEANKKDLKWRHVWFRTLSHMTQEFPALQELSKLFDDAFLKMEQERSAQKAKLERLGKAVIKETNKKLGLGEKITSVFSNNSAKYFEYLDNGKGQFITDTKGLTPTQIAFLNYMKELTKDRKAVYDENEEIIDNAIIQIDKGFHETFKSEGLLPAMSMYMGGGNNLDVMVKNPITGKEDTYLNAQKDIFEANKTGKINKANALGKLLKIAYRAKKKGQKEEFELNYNGQLTSKFDRPREKSIGYSKDFYHAAMRYIDDITHVKHMNKIVPIVDSLEFLYDRGFDSKFPNVKKFLDEWKGEQIYQRERSTDPIIDNVFKFFRTFTSQIVMGFNYPAAVMNVIMGNYNNWRSEGAKLWTIGNKRLFGKGALNKYGIDLLKKYQVVNSDYDSNPKLFAGKLFDMMAYGAQRFGEYQIQGSMFLGLMNEKEWNSFEYNKDGELVVKKGADEKELAKKFNQYKNTISDIQGKYSAKDRRNFMRFEAGKNAIQFRVWAIDWLKERFGGTYIDSHNVEHKGSWTVFTGQAFKELREQIAEKGFTKALWENKQFMANLKGAAAVALLLVIKYQDDEDKKKRHTALSLDNALGNLLFILDPDQAKQILKAPVASFGTVNKFIDVLQDAVNMDNKKLQKDVVKIIPYNKAITQVKDLNKWQFLK